MNTINDFVSQASRAIGVSENSAGSATSGLLSLIKDQVPGADGADFLAKLPGAEALMAKGQSAEASAGGLGGLMGSVGSLLGGKAGSALGLLGMFKGAGMGSEQAGSFVTLFFNFARSQAGEQLVGKVLDHVPELKKLLG